ncbi:MAG: efflux RND transporter periplasmic adaptor subunit [Bacteroidia bacterium]|nr:efflux RND transporter periplasmic adaptor subunit [Bacteroidia bacterium]
MKSSFAEAALLIKLGLFGLIFTWGCSNADKDLKNTPQKGQGKPPSVIVQVMSPELVSNELEFGGAVSPGEFVEIRPEISGRIVYLNTEVEGKSVSTGTVLAKLNAAEYEAQLKRSLAQQEFSQKTEARAKNLIETKAITQQEYDAALQSKETAAADVLYYQAMIEKTIIKAPFSGVVGLRAVSNGAYITPTTVLTTLQQTNPIKIDFTVPERYLAYVQIGQTVKIEIDSKQYTARIAAVDTRLENNSRNLRVRALLQQNAVLPAGGYVRVVITPKPEPSFWLPTAAILPDAKSKQVIRVKNNTAEMVNIQTGIRSENKIEILSGIQTGDSIVVSGMMFVRPNKPVLVSQTSKNNPE